MRSNIIIFPRNASFRQYYVCVSNTAAAVVSAITFEGVKLRSSNLTHALLIQISRTNSRIDIVVQSKMASSAILSKCQQTKVPYRSEKARNAIESDFRISKMAAGGHLIDLNNVRTNYWPTTTWYKFTFGQYIYRQVCWERGKIYYCVRPLGRMHTLLVMYDHRMTLLER